MIEIKFKLKGNGHPRFYQLLQEIGILHDNKNSDYAELGEPLSNLKMSSQFGIEPWIGVLVRLSDKWSRLVQLARKYTMGETESVTGETIKDTLKDLAVYSLLCLILKEEEELGSKILKEE